MKILKLVLLLIILYCCYYMGIQKGIKSTKAFYLKKYRSDSILVWDQKDRVDKMVKTVDSIKNIYKTKIPCYENKF